MVPNLKLWKFQNMLCFCFFQRRKLFVTLFTGSIYFIKISAEIFYLLGTFHLKKFPITLFVSKICLSEKTQKILFSNYSVISSKKLWNQKTKRLHKGFKWHFVFSRSILQTKNELFCCFRCSFWWSEVAIVKLILIFPFRDSKPQAWMLPPMSFSKTVDLG